MSFEPAPSPGGGKSRSLMRELFTGIGGPSATPARLRLAVWVRLAAVLPFIWLPTLVSIFEVGEHARHTEALRVLLTIWAMSLGSWMAANAGILISKGRAPILERYLTEMCAIAHRHEATVGKFIGDCIMIVLGAPEPLAEEEQARRCVELAIELQSSVPLLAGVPLQARTGINTGEAVIGNFGSLVRSDYTVLGPAVNLAARLETAPKPGRILIGPETARLFADICQLEPAGKLTLKGLSEPVEAWWVTTQAAPVRCALAG